HVLICAPIFSFLIPFASHHTATTESYTLSLHDALPISEQHEDVRDPVLARMIHVADERLDIRVRREVRGHDEDRDRVQQDQRRIDRKSTRLNSSHVKISYAVFCLKKKKK